MNVRALVVLGLMCLVSGALADAASGDPLEPGRPATSIRYRTNACVIQLRAGAASSASAAGSASGSSRGSDRLGPESLARLGLGDLARVAAALGGATLEPEFRATTHPLPSTRGAGASASAFDGLDAFYIAHLPPGVDLDRALAAFRAAREVEAAAPIAIVPVQVVPNDSLWSRAYYFYQPSRRDLHGPEAWEIEQGDTSVVLAILDTGVLLHHPDLREQIWINWAERGGVPGVDDDRNGFIDDDRGWDFAALDSAGQAFPGEDWRDEDNDPNDFVAHGSAVSGVAAGRSNNVIGITGTAWRARIMPLRVGWSSSLSPSGEIDLSWVAKAMVYAARNGAAAINCSFTSVAQPDLIAAADAATRAGVAIVAASGNGQPQHYLPDREDVISVAASDANDQITGFSNRGPYVDLAAPGMVISVPSVLRVGPDSLNYRQPTYAVTASGTSFAAPFVTGAIGLIQAQRIHHGLPRLTPLELLMRVTETADDVSDVNPDLTGYGSGRLNLLRALTDPPGSFMIPTTGAAVGPAVVLPAQSGRSRLVFAMSDARLLITEARSDPTVRVVPLSGPPIGGVAAASLGDGYGIGLFVAISDGTPTGGKIAGFDEGGRPLPGWPVTASGFRSTATTEPQLGDLDGDGTVEVVWAGADGKLWAWHADGSRVTGFPRQVEVGSSLRAALSDLDGRPGVEIFVTSIAGLAYVFRGNAQVLPGWPVLVDAQPIAPVIVQLGANPEPALILVTDDGLVALRPNGHLRWSTELPGRVTQPLAAGDLDGAPGDELVLSVSTQIVVVDSTGNITTQRDLHQSLVGTGGPLIGSLARGGAPAILEFAQPASLVLFDRNGNAIGPFPKPGNAGASSSIADVDGNGATDVVAGSGRDSRLFVYAGGSNTWNPDAQQWPTRGGNYGRTGSRLYSPPLTFADDLPPAAVLDLAVGTIGAHSIELTWTAPADGGTNARLVRYDLRRSTQPIEESSFEGADPVTGVSDPGSPGAAERFVVTGLAEGVHYFFALRGIDPGGNPSAISNRLDVSTTSVSPGAVIDLRVVGSSNAGLTLAWTATGDDGAIGRPVHYLVRAAEGTLQDSTFDSAPIALDVPATADAGGRETVELRGIVAGRRYWVALRAVDAAGNVSPLSNQISSRSGPLAGKEGLALASAEQPARPPIALYWQSGATGVGSISLQNAAAAAPTGQSLRIYDLGGRLVRSFALGSASDGVVTWDGRDEDGHRMRAGLYFARLISGSSSTRARIVLVE